MRKVWLQWGGAATAAVLALLAAPPLRAADDSGVRPVAEVLGQRTKTAAAPGEEQKGGLSDSAVRVMMTYAFSLIPEEETAPDGKKTKIDKSDPNKFLIPDEDARRVIRVATRTAYAEACDLTDLARANYQTLMKSEMAKKTWSDQQLLMINALHMFSASYFSGNVKISDAEGAGGATTASKGAAAPAEGADQAAAGTEIAAPKKPQCPPEQKQKVENAINTYVQAAKASPPQTAPSLSPAVPASSGSN